MSVEINYKPQLCRESHEWTLSLNKPRSAVHFSPICHFVQNTAITSYINQTESTLKQLPQAVIDVLLEKDR